MAISRSCAVTCTGTSILNNFRHDAWVLFVFDIVVIGVALGADSNLQIRHISRILVIILSLCKVVSSRVLEDSSKT